MARTFKGGIHPDGMKELTNSKPIEKLAPPEYVILPISMHIGAPCEPLVSKGDYVYMGQKIADSPAPVSAPIHATISGTVRDIVPMAHSNGSKVMSIIIDNDFKDAPHESIQPKDLSKITTEEFISAVREAGIVGHGGAAFPTHIKISSGIGKVDRLIINAAECEPYITSDHRIMLERPEEVAEGAKLLRKMFGDIETAICIENNKQNVVEGLKKFLPDGCGVDVTVLATKYPQGAEKQLIYAVTGRQVLSGKLPADAGCAVFNADTTAAIYRLFTQGTPVLRRIVTVSGSAICEPKNLEVRIGTPVEKLIDACGGFKEAPNKLLMGGPMMGTALSSLDVPVIKGTNAILAFCGKECVLNPNPVCIRCGKCVEVCPMGLIPTYIYRSYETDPVQVLEKVNALDCIECGACTFVCPGKLPLVQGIRVAKQRVADSRRKK